MSPAVTKRTVWPATTARWAMFLRIIVLPIGADEDGVVSSA
jgi:hypothetical protein